MISYNDNSKNGDFHITINSNIKYELDFLNHLTEMSYKILNSKSENIFISAHKDDFKFDKLGIAYLENLLNMFSRMGKKVYVIKWLANLFSRDMDHSEKKFKEINIFEAIKRDRLILFEFMSANDVNEAVKKIAEFIQNHSMSLSKDFLVTTIGEVFSNAFDHSEEERLYFMYDIEKVGKEFYLIINITDFGKTIVTTVKDHLKEKYGKDYTGVECIEWAIKDGNTTRVGSGGHGLHTLIEYIQEIDGELLIFSGESLYTLKGFCENISKLKGFFYGTNISLKIRLFDTSKCISYDNKQRRVVSISLDDI